MSLVRKSTDYNYWAAITWAGADMDHNEDEEDNG